MYKIEIQSNSGKVMHSFSLDAQTEADARDFFQKQEIEATGQSLVMRLLAADGREIEKRELAAG